MQVWEREGGVERRRREGRADVGEEGAAGHGQMRRCSFSSVHIESLAGLAVLTPEKMYRKCMESGYFKPINVFKNNYCFFL